MSAHTPSPWAVDEHMGALEVINEETGFAITRINYGNALGMANARRIVACVNACAGIDTVQLEMLDIVGALESADAVRKQRDDLLAALMLWKDAADNADECEFDDMAAYSVPMPLFCDADEATDAAISKAEGKP